MFSRMSGTEAEEHFWRLPEMVAYFLPYLDAYSLSSLACVLEPTAKILQDLGTPVLISIIKKSGLPLEILNEETLERQRVGIRRLVKLLLKMENQRPLLLELLGVISDRCPEAGDRGIQVICPNGHWTRWLSPNGFVLLEEVEGALGWAEQRVFAISLRRLKEPHLTALSERLLRQEEMINFGVGWEETDVECKHESHARAFYIMMQKCQTLESKIQIRVLGRIGATGWFQLAEACKLAQNALLNRIGISRYISLRTLQPVLQEARLEDLRIIWDHSGSWLVMSRRAGPIEFPSLTEFDGKEEKGWAELEKLWNPSQD